MREIAQEIVQSGKNAQERKGIYWEREKTALPGPVFKVYLPKKNYWWLVGARAYWPVLNNKRIIKEPKLKFL